MSVEAPPLFFQLRTGRIQGPLGVLFFEGALPPYNLSPFLLTAPGRLCPPLLAEPSSFSLNNLGVPFSFFFFPSVGEHLIFFFFA